MPYLSIIPTPYHPSLQRGHSVGGGGGGGNVSPIARPFNYYRRTKSDIQGKIKAIVEKMTQNINYNAIQTPKVVEIKNDHDDDDDDTESNYGDDDHDHDNDDDYTEPATLRAGLCSPACYAEFTVNPYSIADHITFGDALSVLEKVKVEIASGSGSCWCYSKKRENIVTTITAIPQPQDHEKTPRRSLGLGAACDDVLREKWESLGIFRALHS